jgi:hypothetical protein
MHKFVSFGLNAENQFGFRSNSRVVGSLPNLRAELGKSDLYATGFRMCEMKLE